MWANFSWDTTIEDVAATSLGVEGWALHEFGEADPETIKVEITYYCHGSDDLNDLHAILDNNALPSDRVEWHSENELSDLEQKQGPCLLGPIHPSGSPGPKLPTLEGEEKLECLSLQRL